MQHCADDHGKVGLFGCYYSDGDGITELQIVVSQGPMVSLHKAYQCKLVAILITLQKRNRSGTNIETKISGLLSCSSFIIIYFLANNVVKERKPKMTFLVTKSYASLLK